MGSALNNIYIFLGPEIGKKQDEVNTIKENLKSPAVSTERTAEEFIFYPGETGVSEIADTILNISLFADAKIVIIKNSDLIKKKDEAELLVSCANRMEKTTVLILLSDELKLSSYLEDGFANAGMPKNNRRIFYEMFEREKNEWLISFFRREGFSISKDCADAILELIENNTDALKKECTRLIYFLRSSESNAADSSAENRSVTIEDIDKWLSHNREESAFTLFSRIACGDLSKALESLSVMLAAKESAQSILAGLAWCFRKLRDYLYLLETGNAGNSFELKKLGLSSPKAKDDYAAAARRYNQKSVETCLILTADYDALMRSPVAVMENILMDRYVVALFKTAVN